MSWYQRPRKFVPGAKIRNYAHLRRVVESSTWIFCRNKVYHPSIIANWSFRSVIGLLEAGMLVQAAPNPQHPMNRPKPERQFCPHCSAPRLPQSKGDKRMKLWQYKCGTVDGAKHDQSKTCLITQRDRLLSGVTPSDFEVVQ